MFEVAKVNKEMAFNANANLIIKSSDDTFEVNVEEIEFDSKLDCARFIESIGAVMTFTNSTDRLETLTFEFREDFESNLLSHGQTYRLYRSSHYMNLVSHTIESEERLDEIVEQLEGDVMIDLQIIYGV